MRKFAIAGIAVLAIAGSTAVYAQHHRPWSHHHERMSPEDRAAFTDARIAAVKQVGKLNADQEKLWPPVEAAVRDFAKLRIDRANARMNAQAGWFPHPAAGRSGGAPRDRADTMATTAAAMKRIADAADPLYKTLDDGQKRRLAILTRMEGRFGRGGWRHHGFQRGMDRDDGGRGRGFERDRYDGGPGRDRATGAAPSGSSGAAAFDRSKCVKSRWIPAAFLLFRSADMAGEYLVGLLDIGESLCETTPSCEGFSGPVPGA